MNAPKVQLLGCLRIFVVVKMPAELLARVAFAHCILLKSIDEILPTFETILCLMSEEWL